MKSLSLMAAAAALTLTGCPGGDTFDPTSQWQLDLTVITEGAATGHVAVDSDGTHGGSSDCTPGSCLYTFDVSDTEPLVLVAEPATDSAFIAWGGDCSGTSPTFELNGAAGDMVACTATFAAFDPATQWHLTLHLDQTEGAGHIAVDTTEVVGTLDDCLDATCGYVLEANLLEAISLAAIADDGSRFVGWTGDCEGSGSVVEVSGNAGDALDCTAMFGAAGDEVCDNQLDDDASGELDCSDASCTGDTACEPTQFGDFADDDGLDYAHVGTTTCGWPNPLEDWSLTPGGLLFPTLGENTDVFFDIVDGTTYQASASGLSILGIDGYTCTLFESEYGSPVIHVVFSFNCTLAGSPTCSQGFNADRP